MQFGLPLLLRTGQGEPHKPPLTRTATTGDAHPPQELQTWGWYTASLHALAPPRTQKGRQGDGEGEGLPGKHSRSVGRGDYITFDKSLQRVFSKISFVAMSQLKLPVPLVTRHFSPLHLKQCWGGERAPLTVILK